VGRAIDERLATLLISWALRNAVQLRKPDTNGRLHHGTRCSQHTSNDPQQTLKTPNITCSMSRTSCCYGNPVTERCFWLLKHEWTKFESFDNITQAMLSRLKNIKGINFR